MLNIDARNEILLVSILKNTKKIGKLKPASFHNDALVCEMIVIRSSRYTIVIHRSTQEIFKHTYTLITPVYLEIKANRNNWH